MIFLKINFLFSTFLKSRKIKSTVNNTIEWRYFFKLSKVLLNAKLVYNNFRFSCFQYWFERKIKNAVNNTIVLLKAKVAEDPDVHSHSPVDWLHFPILLGSWQILQALHFLHSEISKHKPKRNLERRQFSTSSSFFKI